MEKKGSYVGKIGHGSTQNIKAPLGGAEAKKGTHKITGNDLRTGKKDSK